MAITLATFMFWARMSQVASSTVILGTNGFLIRLINARRLGLTARMIAIQNMAALVLLYTLVSLLVLHICRKSARAYYVVVSIIGDLVFSGVCIAILSIYAIAGVPADCGGLTRENWNPGDAPNSPHEGFTTVRFGHGLYGSYGELDVYCGLPKTNFAMTVILIFTYTLNIILSVLRILSFHYTHKSEVNRLIVEAEMKGKGSYSDLASLITRVASNSEHAPSVRSPPSSPAPSFHSSPISPTSDHHSQFPPQSSSPAPSFHSSPINHHSTSSPIPFSLNPNSHPTLQPSSLNSSPTSTHTYPNSHARPSSFSNSNSTPTSPIADLEMSDLYLPDDVDEIDMADGLVSNGSRGGSAGEDGGVPPPYMPDLEANRPGASRTSLGRYGKDQEFPGLR